MPGTRQSLGNYAVRGSQLTSMLCSSRDIAPSRTAHVFHPYLHILPTKEPSPHLGTQSNFRSTSGRWSIQNPGYTGCTFAASVVRPGPTFVRSQPFFLSSCHALCHEGPAQVVTCSGLEYCPHSGFADDSDLTPAPQLGCFGSLSQEELLPCFD